MSASPKIRDLARMLGIGKSTVQRALAGHGNILPETRDHILAFAEKAGYRPDPLFSSLSKQRSRGRRSRLDLAYVHTPGIGAGINLLGTLQRAAEPLGYQVTKISSVELNAGQRLMDVLYSRGYIGVIIGAVRASLHKSILKNDHLPVVCCGRIDQLPLHTVQPDVTDSIRLTWKKVTDAGYRRIGAAICMHQPPLEDDIDRIGAVYACQRDHRPADRIPPLEAPLSDGKSLVAWFKRHKPDAVISFSSSQYHVLMGAGIDVERIGFASLHAQENSEISGIMEANHLIAQESIHTLDHLIQRRLVGRPENPLHVLVPGTWNEGRTLPRNAPEPTVRKDRRRSEAG